MKILLVEDDADDRAIFTEVLGKLNMPIDLAHAVDSGELFEYLDKNPDINLIFQDINMPVKNGKQCLKDLKSNERYQHIPVIIYTGSGRETDINEAYEGGAHYYIIKPFAPVNLKESMKKVFSVDWTTTQPFPLKDDFLINMTFT